MKIERSLVLTVFKIADNPVNRELYNIVLPSRGKIGGSIKDSANITFNEWNEKHNNKYKLLSFNFFDDMYIYDIEEGE